MAIQEPLGATLVVHRQRLLRQIHVRGVGFLACRQFALFRSHRLP